MYPLASHLLQPSKPMIMDDFLKKLEERCHSLHMKMARFSENMEIIDETRAITDFVRAQTLKLKADEVKLPTKAVTDLELSEIPRLFFLTEDDPTDQELCLSDDEIVSVPTHLGIFDLSILSYVRMLTQIEHILAYYDLATKGSPHNETLLRSQIDAIILSTISMIKRESVYNPRLSTGSVQPADSINSLHLQVGRSIECPWRVNHKEYLLSGMVDYSLWLGTFEGFETNLVMVEVKKTGSLDEGMFQCLAYMGNDLELHLITKHR